MKTIISKLKKCLCLTLSIFLLAPNMQVFAQEAIVLDEISLDFELSAKKIINHTAEIKRLINEPAREYPSRYEPNLANRIDNFISNVERMKKSYEDFIIKENNITHYGKMSSLSEKSAMDILASEYINNDYYFAISSIREQDKIIFNKLNYFIKIFQNVPVKVGNNDNPLVALKSRLSEENSKELDNCISYLEKRFSPSEAIKDFQRYKQEVYPKISSYFEKAVSSTEILEYAYKNGMLPKEKAGVKLTLEAMDADVSSNSLVKNIRKYLTDFGTKIKDVKYYPEESLMRELEGMTLAERAKYVDELTKLEEGSKKFIEDFNKLERPAKRYIGKNITGGAWVSVGLMVGLTLLFELIPQNSNANNINKSLEIVDALDDIAYKIENGEATMPEMLYFYTIPENEDLILNDPVHTLNFVKLASGVMAAEEILEAEQEETKATNENVENSILQRYMEMQQNKKVNVGNVNVADFSF